MSILKCNKNTDLVDSAYGPFHETILRKKDSLVDGNWFRGDWQDIE